MNQKGVYGTLRTASATNTPGARNESVSWTDAAGEFWVFGGWGCDSAGTFGNLNDLWKLANGEWTWMGGSNIANQPGVYGAKGVASASNIPGAGYYAVSWTDSSGNVWLFGGHGYDASGNFGSLNSLWKYSNGEWTWTGGTDLPNQPGVYGTKGVASPTNIPGGRASAAVWTDSSGNVWLFGGDGYDAAGSYGHLSDLWKYSKGEWTWVSGPDAARQVGTYGTMGTPNPSKVPVARRNSMVWVDAQGNLWLFGGHGYDTTATAGQLNDLWRYEP